MTILILRAVPGLRARWTPSLLATLAFSFLLLVLVPSSSSASAIYSYTGNYYTAFEDPVFPVETIFTASDRVTGWMSFAAPLADQAGPVVPDAFSFSNGFHTFTSSDALVLSLIEVTVSGGSISNWLIAFADVSTLGAPTGTIQHSLSSINDSLAPIDVGTLTVVNTVCGTNLCQEIGYGVIPGVWQISSPPASAPEPSILALLSLGLAGLGSTRYRRQKGGSFLRKR